MSGKNTVPHTERRRYPVGTNPRREQRHGVSLPRRVAYDALTVDEKLSLARSRRGHSAREITRLNAQHLGGTPNDITAGGAP